jgi:dGTPase
VTSVFLDNESALLSGKYSHDLLADTPFSSHIADAKSLANRKIYLSESKTKLEIAGSRILEGILDLFYEVVTELAHVRWQVDKLEGRTKKLARLIPGGFSDIKSHHDGWLRVTDFVSGMTDRYALNLYRSLNGIVI